MVKSGILRGGYFGGLRLYTTFTLTLLTIIPASLFYVVYVTHTRRAIIYDKVYCSDGVKPMIILTVQYNPVIHISARQLKCDNVA